MELIIKDTGTDSVIERDIIENAIANDEYLKRFVQVPHWKGLLTTQWADVVLAACVAFYKNHKAAPKKQYIIEYLSQNQKTFRLSDDVLPAMVEFITAIDETKSINPSFEIDNTVNFLKKRALRKAKDNIETALDADNLELAEKAFTSMPSKVTAVDELDVLDMASTLQEATSLNEDPILQMGGPFGDLVAPHIKSGKFVFFLATAKAGKTWCLYTLAAACYNSAKNVLVFAAGDMDKNDNSIRIGHIMSNQDTASDPTHTGIYAFPTTDCLLNQNQTCKLSTNKCKLQAPVEDSMKDCDSAEALMATIPPGYAACANCRHCVDWVPTFTYEPHDVQYKGWQGLNAHKEISKRRNGKTKFRIKIYPNNTLTTQEIERQLIHCRDNEGWMPDVVVIDYADIMGKEEGDNSVEQRHKENARWMNLRKLSNVYPICLLTVTQSNRSGFEVSSIGAVQVGEDKRKLDHATAVFSLSQTPLEKRFRIARTACIMARGKSPDIHKEVVLLQGYEAGRFVRGSFWRRVKEK